jgi:prepilin-type N-terminal cleavage/methylation domain-containing protein
MNKPVNNSGCNRVAENILSKSKYHISVSRMGKSGEIGVLPARGFTLIELLLAVLLTGILLSLAASEFGPWLKDLRLTKASDTLYESLIQARSEAQRIQGQVSLCRTGNIFAADPDCGANIYDSGDANAEKEWTHGWLVYTTSGTSVDYNPALGHDLFSAVESNVSDRKVTIRSNISARNYVTFGPDGQINTGAPVFAVCDERNGAGYGYGIAFSASGRPIVTDYDPGETLACNP